MTAKSAAKSRTLSMRAIIAFPFYLLSAIASANPLSGIKGEVVGKMDAGARALFFPMEEIYAAQPHHLRSLRHTDHLSFTTPTVGGRGGRVDGMFVKPNGDYTGFNYQLPLSDLTPTKVTHTSALYERSAGAVREYALPSGPATVSQSFRVEKFDDTFVRVQTLVQKQTKDVDAKISLALDDPQRILVSVKNSANATISNMNMDIESVKDGRLVGFDIATSGNTMKVYLHTKGDVITERSYSIDPESQAPLAPDGKPPRNLNVNGQK